MDNNNEEHLPNMSIKDYQDSPVKDKTPQEQIVYWKKRAKFFENKAYFFSELLKNIQQSRDEEGESWKRADD